MGCAMMPNDSIKQIRLSQGLFALVNADDYDYLMKWKWHASLESRGTKFYAVRRETIDGKRVKIRMSHAVLNNRGVVIPRGFVVDHVNHNSLDNRFRIESFEWSGLQQGYQRSSTIQLEVVTQQVNMQRSKGWKKKGIKQ
jgi:hypothetical protein